MDKLYSLLAILGLVLLPSCASVGAVIEGGKDFTTGVIDSSVKGVATVSTAVLTVYQTLQRQRRKSLVV